ncbi:MAG: hypothetical protein HOE83_00025 [Alphaproteobacteria bacterium]|jgi:hypothetical protein|nr:hypothetical protein [Alphaproteobacteria bacterium]
MPYPYEPGAKVPGTSADAAEAISSRADTLRVAALKYTKGCGSKGATPDEVACAMGETVLAIRPRMTELTQMGHVQKTKMRRANASGMKATVLVTPDNIKKNKPFWVS